MIRKFSLKDDVYCRWIWLIYDYKDNEELNNWFKKTYKVKDDIARDDHNGTFFCLENTKDKGREYFICLRAAPGHWRTKAGRINTLMHECFHAGHRCLKDAGITFCMESEECFAYYIDTLFYQCLMKLYPELKGKPK
jgi:hypothetical protein